MAWRIILDKASPALNDDGDPDSTGDVSTDSRLTFRLAGTSNLQDAYTTIDVDVAHTNPLVCDDAGRFPQMWGRDGETYDIVWRRSDGTSTTLLNIGPNTGGASYEVSFSVLGEALDGDTVVWNFVRAVNFPTNFAGAGGSGRGTDAATCSVYKNCTLDVDGLPTGGTSVGLITYADDGGDPEFASDAPTPSVVAGDRYFFRFTAANGVMNPSATLPGTTA